MAQHAHHEFTFDEYLVVEGDSAIKHEFLDGRVWAMSGGTPEHAALGANVARLLGNALAGKPCRTYGPDLRVRVQASGLATYPDVTVICDRIELDPEDPKKHTAINPRLIVEVLSPSTEDYDRGDKLGHYKKIPSLMEVVLVAHDRHEVEIVRREADGTWSRETVFVCRPRMVRSGVDDRDGGLTLHVPLHHAAIERLIDSRRRHESTASHGAGLNEVRSSIPPMTRSADSGTSGYAARSDST